MSFVQRQVGPLRLSTLGLGGTGFGGLFSPVDRSVSVSIIESALEAGVTYFDTAPFYGLGRSERVVGDVLRDRAVTLSTKVGRLLRPGRKDRSIPDSWPAALPFYPVFDYSRDGILRSFDDSLQRLGMDRIDLLLVHDIGRFTHGEDSGRHFDDLRRSGYGALDELRRSGQVRAIGIGVNEVEACLDVLGIGSWDAFLLAGRYTLLEQTAIDRLLPSCERTGTAIICGGPFNSGILTGGNTWDYAAAPPEVLQKVSRLRQLAAEFDVPLPALALQFPLGHPVVASVIPGLRDIVELEAILAWTRLPIPQEAWLALREAGLLRHDAPVPKNNPYFDHSSAGPLGQNFNSKGENDGQ